MKTIAYSRFGLWSGRLILEHCPYEEARCELRKCWAAALCHAARSEAKLGLLEQLAAEHRRENVTWLVLAVACLVLLIVAFAWPFLRL
jgi:hypothetical protein